MPTTYAQTIDGNYIYAQRAVQDKNGDDIDQTYAKSASLATVATTGSYSDLSNTPAVDQTYNSASSNAQSGVAMAGALSNKQDTISDLATIRSGAQDGATAVQPGDLATVATSGSFRDLSNTPTELPLVAGNGISITVVNNQIVISATGA